MELLEIRKQNPWWENKGRIHEDAKLKDYASAKVKWTPRLKKYMPLDKNVVYSIRGPRQVGKTTLLKVFIQEFLEKNNPLNTMYFACDLLRDNLALSDVLDVYYTWIRTQNDGRVLIFLDEISSVKDWQKSIKQFIDLHGNKNITLFLTGSHTIDIKSSTERLPGRVGEKEHLPTHKILLPMKFAEYVEMKNPELYNHVKDFKLDQANERTAQFLKLIAGEIPPSAYNLLRLLPELDILFDEYLITGGVMTAVNEYTEYKCIHAQIYDQYIRQLIGDITRINREEKTAKFILTAILKRVTSTYSWNSIKKDAEIPSQPTVEQYVSLLQHMFVLCVYYKIEMDRTIKRASDKKVHILNPFIFHCLYSWLINPAQDPYQSSVEFLLNPENKSKLVEGVIGDHLNRAAHNFRPADSFDPSDFIFYLKTNKGYEVDFVLKMQETITGIEVKYQNALQADDFRGLHKIGKGCMVSKKNFEQAKKIAVVPTSLFLMYI